MFYRYAKLFEKKRFVTTFRKDPLSVNVRFACMPVMHCFCICQEPCLSANTKRRRRRWMSVQACHITPISVLVNKTEILPRAGAKEAIWKRKHSLNYAAGTSRIVLRIPGVEIKTQRHHYHLLKLVTPLLTKQAIEIDPV